MKQLLASQLKGSLRSHWPACALLLVLVLVFVSSALGLVELRGNLLSVQLRPQALAGSFGPASMAASPEFLLLLMSGVVLALLLPLLTPIAASILVLLLAVPPFWLALVLPYRANAVPLEFSLLVLLVLFGINVLMKYFAETREKQRLLDTLGQYVPPEIVGQLSRNANLYTLDGESKRLTVLFCDLRNFTAMSEQLDPKEVVRLLNEYFTAMTGILHRYGATIDKYVGDSIMAFWGAPLPLEDHARRAVLAAFDMHREMSKLATLFRSLGLPAPTIGIGINTGVMNVGNMGSRHRLAYTVIGDPVNLAFRLQGTTREYGVATIVGENTARELPDLVFRELDTITVKGRSMVSKIYAPICLASVLTPEMETKLDRHNQALAAWYAHDLPLAGQLFEQLHKEYPDDQYYPAMMGKLQAAPPRI